MLFSKIYPMLGLSGNVSHVVFVYCHMLYLCICMFCICAFDTQEIYFFSFPCSIFFKTAKKIRFLILLFSNGFWDFFKNNLYNKCAQDLDRHPTSHLLKHFQVLSNFSYHWKGTLSCPTGVIFLANIYPNWSYQNISGETEIFTSLF